ncbi:MAG TPA: inositol monophosphatase family protein [Herpetosiphonaceae bacterium]|nr:inositol monophosphatase family protein [Herpetosiphonaceae bacterium]
MIDYGQVLQIAIDSAHEAGAMLREELLRDGGPRGWGGHAEIDEPVERLIRDRLLAETPGWAFLGEETGRTEPGSRNAAEPAYCWLVDPNDGTSSYLRGARGSAISIALLREGVPVLGVVYAFAAPDNEGDLIAWAEGCGPTTRNGTPVARPVWPAQLSSESIALVTDKADRNPAASVAVALPGRYLALPSIAYRLALAAVGESDIAISTNGPVGWDYAAGHAILRGAGSGFVDSEGRAIRYTAAGDSYCGGICVGGAPDLLNRFVDRLRAARWSSSAPQPRFPLCRPERGMNVADNGVLQRAQGCLLGQLAGDALGSMVEFEISSAIRRHYPGGLCEIGPSPVWGTLAGQPTDDSELALMLARSLILEGTFDEERIAGAYAYWYESHPFDIGGTTRMALQGIMAAKASAMRLTAGARAAASQTSESNGALMRQSPLAIWGHALKPEVLDRYVRADTTMTHPNRVCQDASAAFVVALAAVIREGLDGEGAYKRALEWDTAHGQSPVITRALAEASHTQPAFSPHIGHVPIALQNAFYQALHAPTLEAGVVNTVMGGGDTDTNAAVAGALLGAIHGVSGLPKQWQRKLLSCRPHRADPSAHRPRPEAFWPVDALILAERLATSGASKHTLGGNGDYPA